MLISEPEKQIPHFRKLGGHGIEGPLQIGEENVFFPYSTIGVAPQVLKYHGERSQTRIGARNRIREFVTIHRGTEDGGMLTSIGDDNLLMAYAHVAHDVRVGDHTQLGNAVTFAGIPTMSDNTINAALRRLGYDSKTMTGHGFRAMARTILDEVLEVPVAHPVSDHTRVFHKARGEQFQVPLRVIVGDTAGGQRLAHSAAAALLEDQALVQHDLAL